MKSNRFLPPANCYPADGGAYAIRFLNLFSAVPVPLNNKYFVYKAKTDCTINSAKIAS